MRPFEYFAPESVDSVLGLLEQYGSQSAIMAGGTDVMVSMKERTIAPQYIVHIEKIDELRFIRREQNSIRLGPLTTMAELGSSDEIINQIEALAIAARNCAGPQVRNRGTIGGNLGTASPAGDLITPLMALDAKIKVSSRQGEKLYSLQEFLVGPKKSNLGSNELITEIIVPMLPPNSGSSFHKEGKRKALSISIATAAAAVTLSNDGKYIQSVRVVMGSVGPTAVRARKFEDALQGKEVNTLDIRAIAPLVKEDIKPITDQRALQDYRSELACVLAARSVESAITRARGQFEAKGDAK